MPNDLSVGTRRAGNLIDFDPATPHVHVTLERSSHGISLTVPWSTSDSPYAAWFGAGTTTQPDTGSGTADQSTVPKRLIFADSHGSLMLTGCWPRGFHYALHGPGTGTLWSRAAILGVEGNVDFDHPHGIQTEISGLRDWLGVTSWSTETEWEQRFIATIHTIDTPPTRIGDIDGISFELRPNWQIVPEKSGDTIVLIDTVRACSQSDDPVPWEKHLELHQSLRDLLVLSRWRKESCVAVRVSRNDDPIRTLDGATHGRQWREVVVPDDNRQPPPTGYRPHLIEYVDLGIGGITPWMALRNEFGRALDPVVTGIDLDATAVTRLAHTGPGLEALGYLLMLRDGDAPRQTARATLRDRLERIHIEVGRTLPFDGEEWVSRTVQTYNGLKHANRRAPDELDVANSWRECVLVVRAWVALELGVPADLVTTRLETDPQAAPYVRRT